MNSQNIALHTFNTFSVPCWANNFILIDNQNRLFELTDNVITALKNENFYLLGEGSNTLFLEESVGLIVKSALKGLEYRETEDAYFVKAASGENWHQLILSCLNRNIFGLENLALIPGSVGAAPVQNIGAYGVELSDFCYEVEWFDFSAQCFKLLSNKDCVFGYRDSIFKHELKNKGMITSVTFKLPKRWKSRLSYQGLSELPSNISALQIMTKVIELREAKLPNPEILPNAGSFFKNPLVNLTQYQALQKEYEQLPAYPQQNTEYVKLAAGWLIEKAGLKGIKLNKAAVHKDQALVLVNEGGNGADIVALAKLVTESVYLKFNIRLEPEVRFIANEGECDAVNYIHQF